MATGLEMYDAFKQATRDLPKGATLEINKFDAMDLRKLTSGDLIAREYPEALAEQVGHDLLQGRFESFSRVEGIEIREQPRAPHLIPGEGFRRMAEFVSANEPMYEQFLENLDRLRHPETFLP